MTDKSDNMATDQGRVPWPGGLWRHPDFLRLWTGQTISQFGSWLGALSLLAILTLDATPAQMGLLETLRAVPALLLGLFAGVWVDRARRRPFLIAADLGRALLLGLVVLLAAAGRLAISHVYIVAFLVGSLTVLFDLAYRAYVPALVKRRQLVEANSKLGATESLAEIASPGLGGLLVQLLSTTLTVLIDAISFLLSALFISMIRRPEPVPEQGEETGLREDIGAGLRLVTTHRLLRATAGASATRAFFGGFFAALYSLYVIRELGLSPTVLGLLIGSGGVGGLFGAAMASRFTNRLGWGNALILSSLMSGLFTMLIPLAGRSTVQAILILLLSQLVGDAFLAIFFIGDLSLRQSITPNHLLGRVNASYGFLVGGLGTAGILVGGLLGQAIGLRPATVAAAMGIVFSFLWLFFSPLRGLDDLTQWRIGDGQPKAADNG